mgnify:FL=1
MHNLAPSVSSLLLASCLLTEPAAQDPAAQGDAWQPFLAGKQPTQAELPELLSRLSDMLGSPDPKLRDDTAYTLLSRWILRDKLVDDAQCLRLCTTWTSNLRYRIDKMAAAQARSNEQRDEAVLLRSFSALSLALLAARDHATQFIDKQALAQLVGGITGYLRTEPDERGYVKDLGWVHSTAHAADLVRQLAKNPRLTSPQQSALLDSILQRVQRVRTAFAAGEDDRLARALVELVHRPKFEPHQLRDWLTSIVNLVRPTQREHAIAFGHNRRIVVQSLLTRLLLDDRQTETSKACVELIKQALEGKFHKPR